MKVMQVIDSLAAGGAERVAVSLANALAERLGESHLCVTRLDGPLRGLIAPRVRVLWLNRRFTLDPGALRRFHHYVRDVGITHVHAHSTSLFLTALLKPSGGYRLVWHDHYGRAEQLDRRRTGWLRLAARRVDHLCCVNAKLRDWAPRALGVDPERISLLNNYADLPEGPQPLLAPLPGTPGRRIICLASFRRQKDHPTLLRAFQSVAAQHPDWHLLLAGQDDIQPDYAREVATLIPALGLEARVHWLGVRTDVAAVLQACALGVLSSASEGMPVALLEYGAAGLAAISTRVGHCAVMLADGAAGLLVPPGDPASLAAALDHLIRSPADRERFGAALHARVQAQFSKTAVVDELLNLYRRIATRT